jgi:hypothetical protein
MYEKIDFNNLIKGERYFIRYTISNIVSKWIIGRFSEYYGYHSQLAIFDKLSKNNRYHYGEERQKFHKTSLFYKIITFKQYRKELIEKFKKNILKVILKKIVNEDFEWN